MLIKIIEAQYENKLMASNPNYERVHIIPKDRSDFWFESYTCIFLADCRIRKNVEIYKQLVNIWNKPRISHTISFEMLLYSMFFIFFTSFSKSVFSDGLHFSFGSELTKSLMKNNIAQNMIFTEQNVRRLISCLYSFSFLSLINLSWSSYTNCMKTMQQTNTKMFRANWLIWVCPLLYMLHTDYGSFEKFVLLIVSFLTPRACLYDSRVNCSKILLSNL